MKKTLFLVCALLVSTSAFARSPIRFEHFMLFDRPFHTPTGCDRAVKMEIDYFAHTAKLENTVVGMCEIAVLPNTRMYRLGAMEQDRCGSWLSNGETPMGNDGFYRLRIQDNRRRTCRDMRAPLEVVELGRREGQIRRMYSGR